jgi:hypothetical protein
MDFVTLFWLAHYPTLSLMSAMFGIHERSITHILKRTITGMAWSLKDKIKWPSDEEFQRKKHEFFFFQNWDFKDAVCVVPEFERTTFLQLGVIYYSNDIMFTLLIHSDSEIRVDTGL